MKGFVYVLYSLKDKKTYTGSTDNLERRLSEHKKGLVTATRRRLPIKLVYTEPYIDLKAARKKEKYYKTCAGRKKLAIILGSILPKW